MRAGFRIASLAATTVVLVACVADEPVAQGDSSPIYGGIETILLDDELVGFRLEMTGAQSPADVEDYGRCAAAQYALTRSAGFARHVRTTVDETGGIWRGDAVYTISTARPLGLRTIDAEVAVRDCAARGIPTI
jgi:hypothetical protein